MKTQFHKFREAIKQGSQTEAEIILLSGIDRGGDSFVEALRKDGALRYARFQFEASTLQKVVEEVLSRKDSAIGQRSRCYFESVLALGVLAPEVRSRLNRIKGSINPRSFKTYLITVDRLFRDENFKKRQNDIYGSQGSITKGDLADAFSYYFALVSEKRTPTIKDINEFAVSKIHTDYYLRNLIQLAQIIRFKEAEVLVECFPYQAATSGNSTLVHAQEDEFARCLHWGYIRYLDQRNADDANWPKDGAPSLQELAESFVEHAGDRFCQFIEGPYARAKFELPLVKEFAEAFSRNYLFREEYGLLYDAQKSLLVTFDELRSIPVYKTITLLDLLRFRRLCVFLMVALQEFCRRRRLLGTTAYLRSLVIHLTQKEAFTLAQTLCGVAQPQELYEILCASPNSGVFDLQYTPVLKTAEQYLIPVGVVANGNIVRNALQTTRFRFDSSDQRDPISDMVVAAFQSAGVKAIPRVKYNFAGKNGEIDVLALVGNRLFAFECKNSLHPCNTYELRQSYGYLLKGFDQLSQFRNLLDDPEFVRSLSKKTGLPIVEAPILTTCIIMGNRMFNGYRKDGHSVRNVHELVNVINGGTATFFIPRSMTHLYGPNKELQLKLWRTDSFTAEDLIEFLHGDSVHHLALNAMQSYDEVLNFGRRELRFRNFMFDVGQFENLLQNHPRIQEEPRSGIN